MTEHGDFTDLLKEIGLEVQGAGTMRPLVIAMSNQAKDTGLLFAGRLDVGHEAFEPLTVSTIRALRGSGIELLDGDWLFFPDGAPGHRVVKVAGDGAVRDA